ncbi:hypothetical protein EJ07DRAFT_98923 [Lizonia empirigonia]|nr:hypothetical protein EJ07DRAFT_98923 [Lizonia empirigonia]
MVYRGRPSTGCKNCRERRVKCDETPEGCVKCAKARIVCPGYDRNVDVFFHDETARTEVKAKKAKAKAIALRDARYASTKASSASEELVTASRESSGKESPGVLLIAPLIDQGIAYFMSHYATGLDQPSIYSEAYNNHLATNGFHPLIATSMTALGLAGVANIYRDTALKGKATRWYLDAIKMTNAAISHPKEVTSDNTLLAITLLGMYEATSNEHTLHAWSEHVAGAASLVKMRGMDQFLSPAGRRMYLHAVGLLTMNCLGDGTALPAFVRAMNKEIMKHAESTDPRNRFFFLHQDAVNLRAEIMANAEMSLQTILERALDLDAVAQRVFDDAGPEWTYETFTLAEKNPLVFGDTFHIYPSHAAAQTWNWVRYTKIYIHDIIRNTLLAGLSSSPPIFTEARTSTSSPTTPNTTSRLPILRISGGHSTLWALYIAGAMPVAQRAAQEFVGRCLERFETECGIMQARVLRAALRVVVRGEGGTNRGRGRGRGGICPRYLPEQAGPYEEVPLEGKEGRVGVC